MLKGVTEQELREAARIQAERITVRISNQGNSRDIERDATPPERDIIRKVFFGGLLAIRDGADVQSVADTCEYIAKQFLPEINCYDTIYKPIKQFCGLL